MPLSLLPLIPDDRSRFDRALQATQAISKSPLAMLAWASHLIWSHQFTYSWAQVDGWWCLFAEYPDGVFMPLPPLGPLNHEETTANAPLSYRRVLRIVFDEMTLRNEGRGVTRIENIPEELKPQFESQGFCVRAKDSDYLYRTKDLVELKGDRYKSQRAACNRFMRRSSASYDAYRSSDQEPCLALFDKWADQKRDRNPDAARYDDLWLNDAMLDQARRMHLEALTQDSALGLEGRVIRIGGDIHGYTFGYERNADVFCVLLEVADRAIPGLAQYLFREYCREHAHYAFINTMDDSGLTRLARSKSAYHPVRLVKNFIATMV